MNILEKYLVKLLDEVSQNIKTGNSNIGEDELFKIIDSCKYIPNSTQRMSKEQCCQYLNVSRATFDNFVKNGELPRGEKQQGFKELSWNKADLETLLYKKRKYGSKQNNKN